MMTAERLYEFGVMVSLGTKKIRIAIMVFIESIMLTGLGVLLASAIAYPIMYYLHTHPINMGGEAMDGMLEDFGMEAVINGSINPKILYFSGEAVILITLIIALYPLIKVFRINPLKAMKR